MLTCFDEQAITSEQRGNSGQVFFYLCGGAVSNASVISSRASASWTSVLWTSHLKHRLNHLNEH